TPRPPLPPELAHIRRHHTMIRKPSSSYLQLPYQYTPRSAKGAGDYCVKEGEALVSAPHNPDRERTNVPVVDTHHAAAEIDACGDSISLSLPHHTTAPATTTR
ncbi:hypothetical protein ACIRRI_27325, partial [Streptomyces mirabilis]